MHARALSWPMRKLVMLAGAAIAGIAAHCLEAAVVKSPESPQIFSDNEVTWEQLRWFPATNSLVASITFSNEEYMSRVEPKREERCDFLLPGVRFDSTSGLFVLHSGSRTTPVARFRNDIIGREIRLLPGARLQVDSNAGRIHVSLVTS